VFSDDDYDQYGKFKLIWGSLCLVAVCLVACIAYFVGFYYGLILAIVLIIAVYQTMILLWLGVLFVLAMVESLLYHRPQHPAWFLASLLSIGLHVISYVVLYIERRKYLENQDQPKSGMTGKRWVDYHHEDSKKHVPKIDILTLLNLIICHIAWLVAWWFN
jgi:hypothetical protein